MALNSYRILDTIHHSRRFILYRAEALKDNSIVLIKTQDPTQLRDQTLLNSLKCEAETALELIHPNIRRSIGFFSEGISGYLVAEYVPGISLAQYILQNPDAPNLQQCLLWARDILHALYYAEKRDIRHYNLNPYNIIIDEAERLKIIGFGKDKRDPWKHSEGNINYPFPMLYVAPEIFKSSSPHPNSDLYSWAVILYQMLCHSLPWRLDRFIGPDEQKLQSLNGGVSMPSAEIVPDWLYSILLSCLKVDPDQRVQSISELIEIFMQEYPEIAWQYEEPAELSAPIEGPVPEGNAQDSVLWGTDLPVSEELPQNNIDEIKISAQEKIPEDAIETLQERPQELLPQEHNHDDLVTLDDTERLLTEQHQDNLYSPEEKPSAEAPEALISGNSSDEPTTPKEEALTDTSSDEPPKVADEITSKAPEVDQAKVDLPDKNQQSPHIAAGPDNTIKSSATPNVTKSIKIAIPSQEGSSEEPKDLKTMKNIFVSLMILSIIIVGYLFVDHYFLKEQPQPELKMEETDIDFEEITEPLLSQNIPIEMIWVPADTLIMGSISPEAGDDEFPLLTIPLKGYMISPTEITQAQWMMVSTDNPSLFVGNDRPVENISFYDAVEFCNAKSLKDGLTPAYDFRGTDIICDFNANGYRLPTEAEWEFAAKAGDGRSFSLYSGSDDADKVGWYSANSDAHSHPVAMKEPNSLSIYDMSGNVYEWVWNWYAPYSYRVSSLFSGPQDGTDKVIRGGSWYHNESLMRNTARNYAKPFVKNSYIGFRVVRSR